MNYNIPDLKRLLDDVQSVLAQAASARRGEISGKLAEAGCNSAIVAANRLWEWYSGTDASLTKAIHDLRNAAKLPVAEGE